MRKQLINELWERREDSYSTFPKPKVMPTLDELRKSEWNSEFEELMRNRLLMGAFRYGLLRENKGKYDTIGSALHRLKKYQETGNVEFLIDVANICLIEFTSGKHPNKHFESIDDGHHVQIKK